MCSFGCMWLFALISFCRASPLSISVSRSLHGNIPNSTFSTRAVALQLVDVCTGQPSNTNPTNIPPGEIKAQKALTDTQAAYLTIVNGCNQDFEFLGANQWQMRNWDGQWVTIPAGESAQFDINFVQGLFTKDSDTGGEAYFRIKNTDKRFHIRI